MSYDLTFTAIVFGILLPCYVISIQLGVRLPLVSALPRDVEFVRIVTTHCAIPMSVGGLVVTLFLVGETSMRAVVGVFSFALPLLVMLLAVLSTMRRVSSRMSDVCFRLLQCLVASRLSEVRNGVCVLGMASWLVLSGVSLGINKRTSGAVACCFLGSVGLITYIVLASLHAAGKQHRLSTFLKDNHFFAPLLTWVWRGRSAPNDAVRTKVEPSNVGFLTGPPSVHLANV